MVLFNMPNYKCFQWCNEVVYADKWGEIERVFCKKCKCEKTMQKTMEDVTPRPLFNRPKRIKPAKKKEKPKWNYGGNALWKSLSSR